MAETPLGPSTSGSVVLELGPGIGALVLNTSPELDDAEIEISPTQDGPSATRTHSQVRPRITPAGTRYAAVYPGLAAGEYTLWRDASTPAMTVKIEGAQVTTASWPGP